MTALFLLLFATAGAAPIAPIAPSPRLVLVVSVDQMRFDYLTRFVFNKPSFYRDYQTWPENYRDYVVKIIRDTYLNDKKALRRRLYK